MTVYYIKPVQETEHVSLPPDPQI